MPTVSRDELKKRGIHRLFKSFSYAIDGLKYAFKYEQNILAAHPSHYISYYCRFYI